MIAYFTASIVGKQQFLPHYRAIITLLKSRGHTVIADHILDATESKISMQTKEERLAFHAKLEGWLNTADLVIAETSFPSISVGYEISLALQRGKPILILYTEGDPPSLLAQHKDERIICEKYTLKTLEETVDYFLYFVRGNADMRFTFFITSQIAAYLDEISKKAKIPKSVYLRHLIETDMKEHRFR